MDRAAALQVVLGSRDLAPTQVHVTVFLMIVCLLMKFMNTSSAEVVMCMRTPCKIAQTTGGSARNDVRDGAVVPLEWPWMLLGSYPVAVSGASSALL